MNGIAKDMARDALRLAKRHGKSVKAKFKVSVKVKMKEPKHG